MSLHAELDAPAHETGEAVMTKTVRMTRVGSGFVEKYRNIRRKEGVELSMNSAIQELISLGYHAAIENRRHRG